MYRQILEFILIGYASIPAPSGWPGRGTLLERRPGESLDGESAADTTPVIKVESKITRIIIQNRNFFICRASSYKL
jgi:hypothetical protein